MDRYAYWLSCVKGCTPRVRKQLFRACASAEEVYRLDEKQMRKIIGLTPKDLASIMQSKKNWDIDKEWNELAQANISFTSLEKEDYPIQLRELYDAPYGLYYRGSLPAPGEFRVAVVGARMCSEYGRSIAREIARELALHDVPIVSGMARGIDAAGHRGALDSGGSTYAVFGCGIDICYPNYHKQLYYEIAQHGGLLSEYPPGTRPLPAYFPQRNRLISALSDVVLVIEAKEKSGSLITADFALEQGKDVYALPGRVTDALSAGCNRLIAQGAGVLLSAEDFIKELTIEAGRRKNLPYMVPSGKSFANLHKKSLEKDEQLVYGCFCLTPISLEEVMIKTGLNVQDSSRILASLVQKQQIEEIYQNHYKLKTCPAGFSNQDNGRTYKEMN